MCDPYNCDYLQHSQQMHPVCQNFRIFLTCNSLIQILWQNKLTFLLKTALCPVKEDLKLRVKPYDLGYILDNPILVYLDYFIWYSELWTCIINTTLTASFFGSYISHSQDLSFNNVVALKRGPGSESSLRFICCRDELENLLLLLQDKLGLFDCTSPARGAEWCLSLECINF